jgi:hypothetical protein
MGDSSTILILSFEAFPTKTKAISLHIQGYPPLNWQASRKAL